MPFYEIPRDEKINVEFDKLRTLSVIAVYNQEGKIKPLYVSLVDLYGNVCKTKIEGVKYTKDFKDRKSFICLYKSGDVLRECMLTFYIKDHRWVLENV
jgi:hypothetical protein